MKPKLTLVSGQSLIEVKFAIIRLFIETFAAPPRYEFWTETDVEDYLEPILRYGYASVCKLGDVLLGFNTFVPIQHCHIQPDIQRLLGVQAGTYLSDAAVDTAARGKGIGTALLLTAMHQCFVDGNDICVARTRTDALAIRHVLEKCGFSSKAVYHSFIQEVESERLLYTLQSDEYFASIRYFIYTTASSEHTFTNLKIPAMRRKDAEILLTYQYPNITDFKFLHTETI